MRGASGVVSEPCKVGEGGPLTPPSLEGDPWPCVAICKGAKADPPRNLAPESVTTTADGAAEPADCAGAMADNGGIRPPNLAVIGAEDDTVPASVGDCLPALFPVPGADDHAVAEAAGADSNEGSCGTPALSSELRASRASERERRRALKLPAWLPAESRGLSMGSSAVDGELGEVGRSFLSSGCVRDE